MSASMIEKTTHTEPVREIPPDREIVAVVMSDGTVRPVGEELFADIKTNRFQKGMLQGRDWTLWWESRSY